MDKKEVIIDRNKLSNLIHECCGDRYSIGFHGVAKYRLDDSGLSVDEVEQRILDNGLEIYSGRTLLGTVAFNGHQGMYYDKEDDFIDNYSYGDTKDYILVALPKVLINKDGEEIFVGNPTYNSSYDTGYSTGYQVTSFCDSFLPDYCFGKVSVLNPIFILGKFTVLPDNKINFVFNTKHISFNHDMVPNDFFETMKSKVAYYLNLYDVNCAVNSNLDESLLIDHLEVMNRFCSLNDSELLTHEYHKIMEKVSDDKLVKDEEIVFYSFPFIFNETLFQMASYYDKYSNIDLVRQGKKY